MTIKDKGQVKVTTLPNGLRVATDSMPNAYAVAVGVYVGSGTRHEDTHNHGVSHLLEHMAFKGTVNRSAQEIAISMDAVGGHLNAYTTRESTAYYTKVLAKSVPLAIEIIGDILQNSLFLADDIRKEKAVILQEIAQTQDTPDELIFDLFQETAYPKQPMGWSILGTVESFETLSRDDLIGYLNNHYSATNMIIAAAGNIEHDDFLRDVEKYFSSYKSFKTPATVPGKYKGGVRRIKKNLEQVHFVLGFEGINSASTEFYKLQLYSTILGGGMSSRLYQTIREKHGLAYSIYTFVAPYQDTGLFGVYAGTGEREVNSLMPLLLDELLSSTSKITEEELSRAKDQFIANSFMARESPGTRIEQLAQNIQLFGRQISTEEIESEVLAVTTHEIGELAEKIITSTPTLTALGGVDDMDHFATICRTLKK